MIESQRVVLQEALRTLVNPPQAILLPSWPSWNQLTGGFRLREFSIFCGSTGAGKTTFLANLSAQLLIQGVKHFVMSVETGHADFMRRVISVLAGEDLNTGEAISPEKMGRIYAEYEKYLSADTIYLSLYENRVPIEKLCADLRQMAEKGCKVAFIDNLNFFMEVSRASDTLIEMDKVVHELVILCKQIDIHLVMVMHPKKTQNGTRVESEYDVRGSVLSVQEAHNVWLFNRPDPDLIASKIRSPWDRELTIAKQRRRGQYVGKTLVFSNHATRYSEKGFD